MQSTSNLEQFLPIPPEFTKLAYETFQQGKAAFSLAHKSVATRLAEVFGRKAQTEELSPALLGQMQQRLERLMKADWQDAQQGVYPASLLFDNPWLDFFRYYPEVWLDMPSIWQRLQVNEFKKFSPQISTEGYPNYYLQNFHYQTDGYLSDKSANLYDLQVELLFNGTADAMRRRVLAPLKAGLKNAFGDVLPGQIRVLDVACGTGRTLKMLRAALPQASLYGLDLSPAYLRKANQLLSENPGELPQLVQAGGEQMPYQDNYFHGISCVFLFHELPAPVRQQVIDQCFRTIKPGGTVVLCDSIQAIDSPDFEPMMANFPAIFHEPFYTNYIQDDLVARLEQAGFVNVRTDNYLVSKYWIAQKPVQDDN